MTLVPEHFPLDWRSLEFKDRRKWFEELWEAVIDLQVRYRLPVRSEWWQDARQIEALAALALWVDRYDSGAWDDPPGKLALLFELERIEQLLRCGGQPFHPDRDRPQFDRCLAAVFDDCSSAEGNA